MTDEQPWNPDDTLNRVVAAIMPYRQAANTATNPDDIRQATAHGVEAATAAAGPLTTNRALSLLMAAVLRLADVWGTEPATVPDTLPEEPPHNDEVPD